MKADPEHLLALALSGVLSEEHTTEILESVTFTGFDWRSTVLNNICNQLRAVTPIERLARTHQEMS